MFGFQYNFVLCVDMYQIILEFYSGDSLVSNSVKESIIDTIPQSFLFYILLVLLLIYFYFILFYFIIPLAKKNPEELFNQYKKIRKQVGDIDDLYSNKKLSYSEYVSLQFDAAKEYERIISALVKFPEYKSKIASYNLVAGISKDIVNSTQSQKQNSTITRDKQKKIDALYTLLLPRAKYYTEDEIKLAIKDESFSGDIAIAVIDKIKTTGVVFGSQVQTKTNRIAEFINTLFASKANKVDLDKELVERNKLQLENERKALAIENAKTKFSSIKEGSGNNSMIINHSRPKGEVIDIKEVVNVSKEKSSQFEPIIDFYKIEERRTITQRKKGGLIEAIKVLFKGTSKEKELHSVDEINDIFKDIAEAIKEKRN